MKSYGSPWNCIYKYWVLKNAPHIMTEYMLNGALFIEIATNNDSKRGQSKNWYKKSQQIPKAISSSKSKFKTKTFSGSHEELQWENLFFHLYPSLKIDSQIILYINCYARSHTSWYKNKTL